MKPTILRRFPLRQETWEALTLYSTLAQSELLQGTAERKRPPATRETRAEAGRCGKRCEKLWEHQWKINGKSREHHGEIVDNQWKS